MNTGVVDTNTGWIVITLEQAQGDHAMQALNNNATRSRSIYLITQNILQADIGNYSPICNISNFFRNVKMSKNVNFKIFVLML